MSDTEVPGRRWGVLGTANIAAKAFLPALREAGGTAVVVGSRSGPTAGGWAAADWAAANDVGRADSYAGVIDDPEVDAVYIALPNDQHAHWAGVALAAGKTVLCEKPMALDAAQATALVQQAGPDALLWESFVFPFHPQTTLITELISDGRVGELSEIHSEFHFSVGQPTNIRLQPERGGGALYDVGCYPVRLARLISGREPSTAAGSATVQRVDLDLAAVLQFGADLRLVLSAGMRRPASTFTRLIGSAGELRVSNPFHPRASDTVELWTAGERIQSWPAAPGTAFRYAIDHIHRVLAGTEEARHLATVDAVAQARALDLVRSAAISDSIPPAQEGATAQ